jgi:hypothetical protein
MSRGMICCVCKAGADYICFVPRGATLGLSSFVTADISDVDPDDVLWTWEATEYSSRYVGQCSTYFCRDCISQRQSVLEEYANEKWFSRPSRPAYSASKSRPATSPKPVSKQKSSGCARMVGCLFWFFVIAMLMKACNGM